MKIWIAVSKAGEKILETISIIMLAVMLILIFGDVISRYFFDKAYDFVPLWAAWLMVWITYLIAGLNVKYNRDMSVDLVHARLPKKYQDFLSLLFDGITLGFGITLCWAGIQWVEILRASGRISPISIPIPMWIVEIGIPVCGIILALFSLDRIVLAIYSLRKTRTEEKANAKAEAN